MSVEHPSGADCGTLKGQSGLIRWFVEPRTDMLNQVLWELDGSSLRSTVAAPVATAPSSEGLPPSGLEELCGEPVSWSEDFPTYLARE